MRQKAMNDWLIGIGVLVIWVILQLVVFPKLGVST